MNKIIKFLKSKTFYIASALLIQLIALFLLVTYFSQRFVGIYYILVLLSWIVSLRVINRESDTSSKMLWILLIMSLPFFGGLVYLLFGERKIPKALMIQDRQAYSDYKIYATRNIELMNESHEDDYVLDKWYLWHGLMVSFLFIKTAKRFIFQVEKSSIRCLLKNW